MSTRPSRFLSELFELGRLADALKDFFERNVADLVIAGEVGTDLKPLLLYGLPEKIKSLPT
jgi:hypothetical protein